MISTDLAKRLIESLTDKNAGNEAASALNNSEALVAQSGWSVAAAIIATATSTTTDFGALKVGDLLVHIPAVAGNSVFESVATAGTKPSAAVVGDLYIALRAVSLPAASNISL